MRLTKRQRKTIKRVVKFVCALREEDLPEVHEADRQAKAEGDELFEKIRKRLVEP